MKFYLDCINTGIEARIYGIRMEEDESTLFGKFLQNNKDVLHELNSLKEALLVLCDELSCLEQYFEQYDTINSIYTVCELYCPNKQVRLFCIKIASDILILGNAYYNKDQNPGVDSSKLLESELSFMKQISEALNRSMGNLKEKIKQRLELEEGYFVNQDIRNLAELRTKKYISHEKTREKNK